jgi:hypothetical protein
LPLGLRSPPFGCRPTQSPVHQGMEHPIIKSSNAIRGWRGSAPLLLGLVGILAIAGIRGDSITLTPSDDAELRELTPQLFFGSGTTMVSGGLGSNAGNTRRRALLRFDLEDQIPPGATISSVELTVQVVFMLPPSPVSSNFELRRLLRAWREPAVNWNWAENPVTAWSTGGAGGESDATSTASASVLVTGLGPYTFASTPELVADVQLWLDDPTSNAGWLLRSDTELPFTARHFGTREHSTSPARLTIDYETTAILEPVIIGDVAAADGELTFAFDAFAGVGYRVEFREGMAGTSWQTITNFPPSESPNRLEVRHPIQSSAGLYRVESAAAP